MKPFKPRSPPTGGGAGWAEVLARFKNWLDDRLYVRRLERCFKRLKHEQLHAVSFPRFYHVLKCGELMELNPDWKQIVLLFLLNHASAGPDDHIVVHFLRWLRD